MTMPFLNAEQLLKWRSMFNESVTSFPEYKDASNTACLVQGGFAALGNASSFHCPFSRYARSQLQETALLLFRELGKLLATDAQTDLKELRMEQLIDRLLIRDASKTPTAESWHRDQCPFPKEAKGKDVAFGGWVNFDTADQYFSCVKGTHGTVGASGFRPITDQKEKKQLDAKKSLVTVKPGTLLSFAFPFVCSYGSFAPC